jgi:hypothetical protein
MPEGFYCSECDEDHIDPEWDDRTPYCPKCGNKVTWKGIDVQKKPGCEYLVKKDGEWQEIEVKKHIVGSFSNQKQMVIDHEEKEVDYQSGRRHSATIPLEDLEFCVDKLES